MENKLVKDIDFEHELGIVVQVEIAKMERLGCLEDYKKLRGGLTEGIEYDYVGIYQARILGLIK